MKSPYTHLVKPGPIFTLSVVTVSAHDTERLKTTLNSFLAASNLTEFVVICPPDDHETIDFVNSFMAQSNLEISVHHDKGTGVYQAMNLGANRSRGLYLIFWNAGDTCSSTANLNTLNAELSSSAPEWGIFQAEFGWRDKQTLSSKSLNQFALQKGGYISHQSVVVKKSEFIALGLFDLSFKVAADTALITRFWKKHPVNFFHYPVVNVEFPNFSAKNNRLGRFENIKIALFILPWKSKFISIGFALFREFRYAFKRIARTIFRKEVK